MPSRTRISRSAWPWGRMSPAQRIRDIRAMIDRNRAQIPIIRDQADEAVRRIELNLEVLEEQMIVAERFLEEEVRAENKGIAYELSLLGVDVIERVSQSSDQRALNVKLREMLSEAKAKSEKPAGEGDDLEGFFTN
jgi:hypothetical protein